MHYFGAVCANLHQFTILHSFWLQKPVLLCQDSGFLTIFSPFLDTFNINIEYSFVNEFQKKFRIFHLFYYLFIEIVPILQLDNNNLKIFEENTMLVNFSVQNFLSFNKETTFSMESGRVSKKTDHLCLFPDCKKSLLKFAAIFGKNGAGKSNFIRAVAVLQNYITKGILPRKADTYWCRLYDENEKLPTVFKVSFITNNKLYSYTLSVVLTEGKIVMEKLENIVGNRHIVLFCKEDENAQYVFHRNLRGKTDDVTVLARNYNMNGKPFLYNINHNTPGFFSNNMQAEVLLIVFRWFADTLEVIFPDQPLQETSLLQYNHSKDNIAKLLNQFATGIVEIKLEPTTKEKVYENLDDKTRQQIEFETQLFGPIIKKNISEIAKNDDFPSIVTRHRRNIFIINYEQDGELHFYSLIFVHKTGDKCIDFHIQNESDGTHRLFQLLEILICNKEKVFVMDEINRSLHPKLTVEFIKKFFESSFFQHIQLITTTHETRIMTHDLVRRDELWLADTNEDASTNLYSLESKQVRIDKVLEENYLEGIWGGVPKFE